MANELMSNKENSNMQEEKKEKKDETNTKTEKKTDIGKTY